MADNDYSWDNQPGLHKWNRGRMNRENMYGERDQMRYGFGHTGEHGQHRGVRGDFGHSYHDNDPHHRQWVARDRDWREDEYDRRRMGGESIYGGDTRNYGNANQGGFDHDWWQRARNKVSSWFGGDRDDDRNRRDEGPHRGKGPKGYTRSDERIREDVYERLSYDPSLDASEIDIKVEGSEVVLTGVVSSRDEKYRAEDLVEHISGVRTVKNQIRVDKGRGRHAHLTRDNRIW